MSRLIDDRCPDSSQEADAGIRTPDPFITSEVLYQLSYVGIYRDLRTLKPLRTALGCTGAAKTWRPAACGKRSQPSRCSL
jgi:hypothetical protein